MITPARRATAMTLSCLLVLWVVLRLAVRGALPGAVVSVLAPAALLGAVAAAFRVAAEIGAIDRDRPLHRRHGFWAIAIGVVVGLPMLGSAGLVDPWETHYGEVAREMLERHDFVSTWWANEGWFMSKPVLTFWLEATSMWIFGVHTGPDQVLGVAAQAHPEWAIRFPGFVLALVGSSILYAGVARTSGRRAALVGVGVLWTMPGFALLARQAITDVPMVGGVSASLGLLLLALSTSNAATVSRYPIGIRGRTLHVHAGHLVAAMITLAVLPQLAYLVLEHVHVGANGVRFGADQLRAGSPHACGLPSQPPCMIATIAHPRLTPLLQAVTWALPTLWLVVRAASETRAARLFATAAWFFAALGAMAKGPVGLVIPAAAAVVCIVGTGSFRALLRLEILAGLVLATVMIGPWYLAIFGRHGRGFLDELVMRHMLGRTLDHLHDTNDGDDVGIVYFVRQLGYATFPWSGIALVSTFAFGDGGWRGRRGRARAILFGAAIATFALVSIMRTKFHHYVLPALPPLAMLSGIGVDELLGIAEKPRGSSRRSWSVVMLASAAGVVGLVGRDLATSPGSFVRLMTYRYGRAWAGTASLGSAIAVLAAIATLATLACAWPRIRRHALATVAGAAAVGALAIGSVYLLRCGRDGGQRDVIAAFYRDRSPDAHAPLVAYQLNWKGENFYTGNDVAIFISSGAPLRTWLDRRKKERGDETFYFVTERGRVAVLRSELGTTKSFTELTDRDVSAEFTLVRATL